MSDAASVSAAERRRFLAPLALARFICSFAGSNTPGWRGDSDFTAAAVPAPR